MKVCKLYEHEKVTLSSLSLRWKILNGIVFPRTTYLHFSLCKTKFLEKHSSGDLLSVNLPDGVVISRVSATTHRRVSSEYLNFGYTDCETVIVLTRDRRTKHSHLDLYDLTRDYKLKGWTHLKTVTLHHYSLFRNRSNCQTGRSYTPQMFFNARRDYPQYYWRSHSDNFISVK